jgi:NADPH2:quinone reductase
MKAIVITQPGAPDVLHLEERPIPTYSPDEVLVKVAAAGVNRPDVAQRKGHYPPPPGASPDIPGLEIAGTIVQTGANVSRWKVGDQICALVTGGGYAEYCVVPAGKCLPVPAGLTLVEAASLPETFFTVWSNVFDRGR